MLPAGVPDVAAILAGAGRHTGTAALQPASSAIQQSFVDASVHGLAETVSATFKAFFAALQQQVRACS
jgi:hypothetical protein